FCAAAAHAREARRQSASLIGEHAVGGNRKGRNAQRRKIGQPFGDWNRIASQCETAIVEGLGEQASITNEQDVPRRELGSRALVRQARAFSRRGIDGSHGNAAGLRSLDRFVDEPAPVRQKPREEMLTFLRYVGLGDCRRLSAGGRYPIDSALA